MPEDRQAGDVLSRAARVVVPWVGLIVVVTIAWSILTDYRAAVDAPETTSTVEATASAGVVSDQPYVVVLSDGLNLRAEPSTDAAVVSVLNADTKLALVEQGTGWYHVRLADGTEGWVAAGGRFTRLVEP